jgi:hypothetical protein
VPQINSGLEKAVMLKELLTVQIRALHMAATMSQPAAPSATYVVHFLPKVWRKAAENVTFRCYQQLQVVCMADLQGICYPIADIQI